jgi:hypothetical protein
MPVDRAAVDRGYLVGVEITDDDVEQIQVDAAPERKAKAIAVAKRNFVQS